MTFFVGQKVRIKHNGNVGVVVAISQFSGAIGVSVSGFRGHSCDGSAPKKDGYWYGAGMLETVNSVKIWPPKESRKKKIAFQDRCVK